MSDLFCKEYLKNFHKDSYNFRYYELYKLFESSEDFSRVYNRNRSIHYQYNEFRLCLEYNSYATLTILKHSNKSNNCSMVILRKASLEEFFESADDNLKKFIIYNIDLFAK